MNLFDEWFDFFMKLRCSDGIDTEFSHYGFPFIGFGEKISKKFAGNLSGDRSTVSGIFHNYSDSYYRINHRCTCHKKCMRLIALGILDHEGRIGYEAFHQVGARRRDHHIKG